jgi:hypothetical protein
VNSKVSVTYHTRNFGLDRMPEGHVPVELGDVSMEDESMVAVEDADEDMWDSGSECEDDKDDD